MARNRNAEYTRELTSDFQDYLDGPLGEYTLHYNTYKHDVQGLIQKNAPAIITIIPDSVITGRILNRKKHTAFKTTNKFILTNYRETRAERTQVLETFGKPAIFFFDESTRNYSFDGILVDNQVDANASFRDNLNWADNFKKLYDEHLRATRLAANGEIALISVNDNLMYGYPTSLVFNTTANNPNAVSFGMNFLVLKHTYPKAVLPNGNLEFELWRAMDIDWFTDKIVELEEKKDTILTLDDHNDEFYNHVLGELRAVGISLLILGGRYSDYLLQIRGTTNITAKENIILEASAKTAIYKQRIMGSMG